MEKTMENYIIIAMIILAAVFGIRSSLKHFKGQGGCCEGGDYKIKKKRLKIVMYKKPSKSRE